MLQDIKLLMGVTDDSYDELILLLVEKDTSFALDYTHRENSTEALDYVIMEMVVEDFNRIGSEGVTSRNLSGISESYLTGYSDKIINALNKHRRLRTV